VSDASAPSPPVSSFLQYGFRAVSGSMLRRSFHTLAVVRETLPATRVADDQPLIVYANHASWWDPLVAHYLCRHVFRPRQFYAPIDAEALRQYRVFAKLGFYGVQMNSAAGSAAFLKTSKAILATPGTSLWMTPEGRFVDVRDHTTPLAPGLAHLCSRLTRGTVLPLAMEYAFWEERLPECLLGFGQPLVIEATSGIDKAAWSERLTMQLRAAQRDLARLVVARSAEPFEPLLRGARGAGRTYDVFRRFRSGLRGERLPAQHGKKFQ